MTYPRARHSFHFFFIAKWSFHGVCPVGFVIYHMIGSNIVINNVSLVNGESRACACVRGWRYVKAEAGAVWAVLIEQPRLWERVAAAHAPCWYYPPCRYRVQTLPPTTNCMRYTPAPFTQLRRLSHYTTRITLWVIRLLLLCLRNGAYVSYNQLLSPEDGALLVVDSGGIGEEGCFWRKKLL